MIEQVDTKDSWLPELASLDTPEARQAATKGTVEDWASESLLAAREAYKVHETVQRLKSGQKILEGALERESSRRSAPALSGWCQTGDGA
jgi:hypothetical protein